MKKRNRLLYIIFILVIVEFCCFNFCCVEAKSGRKATEDDVLTAMSGIITHNTPDDISKIGIIINTAIGFIQITGTGISVIMVTVLGIKYMLAAPSDKADVKKQIAPLLIGAVLLFASVNIIQFVANFAETLPTK